MTTDFFSFLFTLFLGFFYLSWIIGGCGLAYASSFLTPPQFSRTLTFTIVACATMAGAYFFGSVVSTTWMMAVVDWTAASQTLQVVKAMAFSMVMTACIVQVGSYFGHQLSTTYVLAGTLTSVAYWVASGKGIYTRQIFLIISAWILFTIIAVVLSGLLSYCITRTLNTSRHPYRHLVWMEPTVLGLLAFGWYSIVPVCSLTLFTLFVLIAMAGWAGILLSILPRQHDNEKEYDPRILVFVRQSLQALENARILAFANNQESITICCEEQRALLKTLQQDELVLVHKNNVQEIDRRCAWWNVLLAPLTVVLFAANDVANAVAPCFIALQAWYGPNIYVAIPFKWLFLWGGALIVFGFATSGWFFSDVLRQRSGHLPARTLFSSQITVALLLLIAYKSALPLSVTQLVSASLLGQGLLKWTKPDEGSYCRQTLLGSFFSLFLGGCISGACYPFIDYVLLK